MAILISALLQLISVLVYGRPRALAERAKRSTGREAPAAALLPRALKTRQRCLAQACGGRRGADRHGALNRATIGPSGAGPRDGPIVLPWRPAS